MTEESVPTRLGPLYVRRLGAGTPLLLWHSLYVDGRSMLPVAEALAPEHDVVVVDGPGHGRSPPVGRPFDIAECARAAVDLLHALGLGAVDWVGNAWGGHVGVALARLAPARVRSLVAICAPLQPVDGMDRVRGRLLVAAYRLLGPRGFLAGALQDVLVAPEHTAARAYVREVFLGQDPTGMLEAMRYCMLGRTSLEGPIPVPARLVTTADDALWTPELVAAQAEAAGASWSTLTGARHLPPLETPDAVVSLVREWLAERAAGTEASASTPA